MNYGVVITHGDMGHAMLSTMKSIIGDNGNIISMAFNRGDDIDRLRTDIADIISEHPQDQIFLFADMFGGSCANTVLRLISEKMKKNSAENRIFGFAGVNLSMLIFFSSMSKSLSSNELRDMIIIESKRSIIDIRETLEKRGVQ